MYCIRRAFAFCLFTLVVIPLFFTNCAIFANDQAEVIVKGWKREKLYTSMNVTTVQIVWFNAKNMWTCHVLSFSKCVYFLAYVCVWLTGVQVLQRRDPAGSLTQVSCISQVSNTRGIVGYLYCLWVIVVYNTVMCQLVFLRGGEVFEFRCVTAKCRLLNIVGCCYLHCTAHCIQR